MTFGIIGTNFISDAFVAALPFAASRATAVFSRRRETGEAFAQKHGIPHVFDDMDAFLSSDAFDAVYVASPNACHEEQSLRALTYGKHVLCEKPIAPSLDGFLRMQAAAKKNGCVLMEAMRPHHDKMWKRVREWLPRIGAVRGGHFEYCQYSSRYGRHLAGEYTNTFDPSLSNAAMLDIGIYPIAMAVWLFGRPQGVTGKSLLLENGFEGAGNAVLDFGTHSLSVSYSKVSDSVLPSSILGEAGAITVDKISSPTRIELLLRSGEKTELLLPKTDAPSNMYEEILAFSHAVEEKNLSPLWRESADALFVCDTLRRAAGICFPSDGEDAR